MFLIFTPCMLGSQHHRVLCAYQGLEMRDLVGLILGDTSGIWDLEVAVPDQERGTENVGIATVERRKWQGTLG